MTKLVAIGASWGGLDAVQAVLAELPADLPAAVVVAQHRSASSQDGMLENALARRASMPVCLVDDKDPVRPGQIYVAPADYHLLVEDGHAVLSTDVPVVFSRPSIDVLFESVADAFGSDAVGVLLTGANEDGTDGLRAIRRRGGLAIVQDPESAERPEMPQAAVDAGVADVVLPLEQIPSRIVEACA